MKFSAMLLSMPRYFKITIIVTIDIFFCFLSVWLGYFLRVGEFAYLSDGLLISALISVCLSIPINSFFGLYHTIYRYGGWSAFVVSFYAVLFYGCLYSLIVTIIGVNNTPRTLGIIQPLLLLFFVGSSRAIVSFILGGNYKKWLGSELSKRIVIYGAGNSGRQLSEAISKNSDMQIVGFLDDDPNLQGRYLNRLLVHNPSKLSWLIDKKKANCVLLAMPCISRRRRYEILTQCESNKILVLTLPDISKLILDKVNISDIKELDNDDLLGREPSSPDLNLMRGAIFSKVVLVTGAGGSIGSELCRQILNFKPTKILLLEHSEYALYLILTELLDALGDNDIEIIPFLASVQDFSRLSNIIKTYNIDIIYHAAAYKHVSIVELNQSQGIANNVFGTLNIVRAAIKYNVDKLILISTDKAVSPTSIMGASKRLAEIVVQAYALKASKTKFSIVRFGNVIGSSGSVIPKFKDQIKKGGPITITHPDTTRFFMTVHEAAQLVIQAGALSRGGEIFSLDMGPAIRIIDLAKRMINLSGLSIKDSDNVDGDIEIEIIGLGSGEKIHEEILVGRNSKNTILPNIMITEDEVIPLDYLDKQLVDLEAALINNDLKAIHVIIKELTGDYIPPETIDDYLYFDNDCCCN